MNIVEVIEEVGLSADWRNGPGWAEVAHHPEGYWIVWNPHAEHLSVYGKVLRFEGLRPDLFPSLPTFSHGWLDIEPLLALQKRKLELGGELPPYLLLTESWKWSDVGTVLVAACLEVPTEGWEPTCPQGHEWEWREWGLASFGTYRFTMVCKRCLCRKPSSPLAKSKAEAEFLKSFSCNWLITVE